MIKILRRLLKIMSIALVVFMILGLSYQYVATKLDERKYPPVGRMVDVGGYKLHMIEKGKGVPTVILEAGYAGNCLGWSLVQSEVAKFTKVISYDRAGYGWSDGSPLARSNENIVQELLAMLENAGISAPYILVGHSRGGLNVRLFAQKYPNEVAGVILVDTRNENQSGQYPESFFDQGYTYYIFLKSCMAGYLGYNRLFLNLPKIKKDFLEHIKKYPDTVQNMFSSQVVTAKFKIAMAQEELYHNQNCYQLRLMGGSLHDIPLTVITAGKPFPGTCLSDDVNTYWQYYQKELVSKSSQGKQIIAEHSGHDIPYDQPEIIVQAVREMVEEVQGDDLKIYLQAKKTLKKML